MEALAASAGTMAIVAGYMIIKRCRSSTCHADSGCCEITSPALELAKKQTERLEMHDLKLEEILIMLGKGQALLGPQKGEAVEALKEPTIITA